MDYITVDALRREVKTELDAEALEALIRRASAAISRTLGAEPGETVTQRFAGERIAWLSFEPGAVESVVENGTELSAEQYAAAGRAVYKPSGAPWEDVAITYTLAGREDVLALCEQVCVELVKCMLAQSGYASERVGDWSGDADPGAWSRALAKLRRWRPGMA